MGYVNLLITGTPAEALTVIEVLSHATPIAVYEISEPYVEHEKRFPDAPKCVAIRAEIRTRLRTQEA